MAATRKLLFILILVVYLEHNAIGKTKIDFVNSFMDQTGHHGHQVQDGTGNEHLLVGEPAVYLDATIGADTDIFASALVDLWTSASESAFDTNTGASGRGLSRRREPGTMTGIQNRIGFDFGVAQKIGSWKLTPRIGFSTEFDYHSLNGGLRAEKNLLDNNLTLALGYQVFVDSTHPFDATASQFLNWKSKITHSIDASVTQILTPSDLISAGYSFTNQSGFLAGTQNTVDVSGTRINEVLPSNRRRNAATFRYVHGWNNWLSTHLDYRFYFDNWGIMANTIEPSLYFAFHDDDGLVKVFYRFHTQTASKYYQDSFRTPKAFMTSDSDLAKFVANEGGVMASYTWNFKDSILKSVSLNGSGVYYRRSNDLTGLIMQLGIGGVF